MDKLVSARDRSRLLWKELGHLRSPGESLDSAFIRWYLQVRLGARETPLRMTDGPGDGGIDAIQYPTKGDKDVVIVQALFADPRKNKNVPGKKLNSFLALDAQFGRDSRTFSGWLKQERIREDLKAEYSQLNRRLREGTLSPQWLFLTTGSAGPPIKERLRRARIGKHSIVLIDKADVGRAFDLYLEGAAPPDKPLEFRHTGPSITGTVNGQPPVSFYVAQLDDLLSYVRDDQTLRLFSRNVRLRVANSPINEGLQKTFKKHPEEMLLGHNGITLICSKATQTYDRVTLEQPNVVNGAQTLLSLKDLGSSRGRARLLVRVIQVGDYAENSGLIRDIVVRSNSQNAISPVDLVACDQRQVEIERFFRAKKRTYIRRRGQEVLEMGARAGVRVRSARLAQILACCHRKYGVAVAGGSKNKLFQNDLYRDLFVESSLEEIFAKYCLYELTEAGRRSAAKSVRNKYRYVWRNVLAAAWRVIDQSADLRRPVVTHGRIAKLSSETPPASELMKVLRDMHQFGWNRYLAARSRTASLKPDHFFFGDEDRAEDLVQRIEGKYRNRLARVMRRALEAP